MKHTWEISDIKLGQEILRGNVRFVIGYYVGINGPEKYCLIDLRDGAVMGPQTKEQLVESLSKGNYSPRYVPA